jgi:hypothetical protein
MRRWIAPCLLLLALAAPAGAEEEQRSEAWNAFLEAVPPDKRPGVEERLRRMSPESRAKLFSRFQDLSPEEREEVERMARGEGPSPRAAERRERLANNMHVWRDRSPAERETLRRRLRGFRALSAAQQEALVEQRFAERSSDERREILARLRTVRPAPPAR